MENVKNNNFKLVNFWRLGLQNESLDLDMQVCGVFLTLVTKKYTLFEKKIMIDESCADYDHVPTFIFTPTSKALAPQKK